MCIRSDNPIFYVYVYLDPMKPGKYVYGEYEFDYEPFYIGKGCNGRAYVHLTESVQNRNGNRHFYNKIKKIQRIMGIDPIIKIQKDGLIEQYSHDLEVRMVATIGRHDKKKGPLCNLTDAGEGISGYKHTEESRKKMSISHKGKTLSDETKAKLSKKQPIELVKRRADSLRGHVCSEETKRKIGNSNKKNGRIYSYETMCNVLEMCKQMNQTQVSKKVGIPRTTIQSWLKQIKRDGCNPSLYY